MKRRYDDEQDVTQSKPRGRWDRREEDVEESQPRRGRWDREEAEPLCPDPSLRNFLAQLLGPSSTYLQRFADDTGCSLSMAASGEIMVKNLRDGDVASARRKITELFSLSTSSQERVLGQYLTLQSAPKVETSSMDFSNLDVGSETALFKIPKEQMGALTSLHNKQLFEEATGVRMDWDSNQCILALKGSVGQRTNASALLKRVTTHCQWGSSEAKVAHLIKPDNTASYKCRLSAMNTSLQSFERNLSLAKPVITIGKDNSNDVVVKDEMTSRRHCLIEFDHHRGGVYVIDVSTNGTFLNGKRLPQKGTGKVLLTHGDDITFREPEKDREFGYMVNLQ